MAVGLEQAEYGIFHIWVDDPEQEGVRRRYTYLLGDNIGMGEKVYKTQMLEQPIGNRVPVDETPDHRQVIRNCNLSLTLLGRKDIAKLLPKDDEPLIIYQNKSDIQSDAQKP